MDKSIGAGGSTLGIMADAPDIEIEIEHGDDGSVTVTLGAEEECGAKEGNLAEGMDEDLLHEIGADIIEMFEEDLRSRRDWIDTYFQGIELLGLKYEERTLPWKDACGVYHPMLSEAVVRFQSEAITETFPAMGPVKTVVVGKETPEKLKAAARVAEDMNFKLTEEMSEYRPEHERLLWALPIAGTAFKKIYKDGVLGRQTAMFVPAEDVVMPYGATGVDNAERVTHIMRMSGNDVKKHQVSGFYMDVDLGEPVSSMDDIEQEKVNAETQGYSAITDNRFRLLEMQLEYDLPGHEDPKGVAFPYIITVEKQTGKVLSIRKNYDEDDVNRLKLKHFVQYNYVPGFGAYGLGLLHLIGGYARSATSITRQLVDAGTLCNLPGGLKSKGLRTKGDNTPIGPGEFRDVDVPSGRIQDNIMIFPFKEPSMTLYQLLGDIVNEGKSFINASDLNVSDMSGQAPVGTTLALLERQLKVMSAIQARMHFSMKQEFKLLKAIISECMPASYDYDVEDAERSIKREDYAMCDVVPVSDPNAATMAHKVIQYQTVTQLAQQNPGIYDLPLLHRQMIETIGIKNAAKLVPTEDDVKNTDPITENQKILNSSPVKAFLGQDHEAHITVHMSAMQDPKIQGLMQQNPNAPAIMAQMQNHIAAHVAFEYRKQMEKQMGITLPPEDEELPPEFEVQLSRMAADGAQKLLQANQQEVAQQQAQQAAQDPMVQMQQKELEQKDKEIALKEREVVVKEKALEVDAAHKADQIETKNKEIASREETAGMQMGITASGEKERLAADQQNNSTKIGVDLLSKMADHENAKEIAVSKPKPTNKKGPK